MAEVKRQVQALKSPEAITDSRRHRSRRRERKTRSQQHQRFAEIGDNFDAGAPSPRRLYAVRRRIRRPIPAAAPASTSLILSPDDCGTSEIEAEIRCRLQDHSRIGLAPGMIATVFADAMHGVIGAVIDARDRRMFRLKAFAHPSRQVGIGAFVEIAPADAGLVGDDDDRPAQLVRPEASQFENSGNELELLGPMDIAMVHVDHAVTVEKKRAAMHGNPIAPGTNQFAANQFAAIAHANAGDEVAVSDARGCSSGSPRTYAGHDRKRRS